MVPEWLLSRLDASDRRALAEHFASMAQQIAAAADAAAYAERISMARRMASKARRDAVEPRNREIRRLYKLGLEDDAIGRAVGLSGRSVRRVLAEQRKPFLTRLARDCRPPAALRQDKHQAEAEQRPEQPVVLAIAEDAEAGQRDQAAAE